jgi:hypothetical protein
VLRPSLRVLRPSLTVLHPSLKVLRPSLKVLRPSLKVLHSPLRSLPGVHPEPVKRLAARQQLLIIGLRSNTEPAPDPDVDAAAGLNHDIRSAASEQCLRRRERRALAESRHGAS